LRVISRTSAMRLKGTKKDLQAIAAELKVRYVLEGSVRKAGNNLRITAQLIDAPIDAHIWAEKYTGTLDDVFAFQEQLSRAIVDALKVHLTPQEADRLAERPIPNLAAYECFLKARAETYHMTPDSLERALRLTQEGLALVGENELLHFMLGHIYGEQSVWGLLSHDAANALIAECVGKILKLNPHSAKGRALLGMMQYFGNKRVECARSFRQVLELEPNDPDVLVWLISVYVRAGRFALARPLLDQLIAIDPLTPISHNFLAQVDWFEGGSADEFLAAGRRFMESDPANHYACSLMLHTLFLTGRLNEEAYPILNRLIGEAPESGFGRWATVLKWALGGEKEAAVKAVTPELLSWAQSDDLASYWLAGCYALLEMQDEVLHWLENMIAVGGTNYLWVAKNPYLMRVMRGAPAERLLDQLRAIWATQALWLKPA